MRRFSRPRATAELSKSLNHDLNMYTLAAGAAGVGLLALAQPAQARIIYTPAHDRVLTLPLDLNHDGIVDFYLSHFPGSPGFTNTSGLAACQYVGSYGCLTVRGTNAIRGSRSWGAALRHGQKIGRGDLFIKPEADLGKVRRITSSSGTTLSTRWYGAWMNEGKGVKNRYLGLKFKIKGKFHFGWARLTVTTTKGGFTAILTGYAYEAIPGKGIIAGQTKGPDVITLNPASLGHLAAGASAIPVWRSGR